MPNILAHFWKRLSNALSTVMTRLILLWMLGESAVAEYREV